MTFSKCPVEIFIPERNSGAEYGVDVVVGDGGSADYVLAISRLDQAGTINLLLALTTVELLRPLAGLQA